MYMPPYGKNDSGATLRGNFFALMGHGGLDSEHSGAEPHLGVKTGSNVLNALKK